MSLILINQYTQTDNHETDGKALQDAFTKDGVKSVVVPAGLDVQQLHGVGNGKVAVIRTYGDTKVIREGAAKLKKDLAENDISAIILPVDTNVEILHT